MTSTALANAPDTERAVGRQPRRVRVSSVGAGTLLLAGAIHLMVAIAHVPGPPGGHHVLEPTSWEHWAAAIGLAVIGVAQIFVGAGLWALPTPGVVLAGIALNVVTLVLYIASRTMGLPFGATAWRAESVGLLDLTVAMLEVAGIIALAACLPERQRSRVASALMTAGLLMVGARLVAGILG